MRIKPATEATLAFQTPPQLLVGVEQGHELLNVPLLREKIVIGAHDVPLFEVSRFPKCRKGVIVNLPFVVLAVFSGLFVDLL